MPRTVAIIGAGQIAFAAASQFLVEDWEVVVCARHRPPWMFERASFRAYDKTRDAAPQADVVLDTIAFDAEDVERYDPEAIERLIVVSSASVYCDDEGRTLDEAAANGFPEFDGAITEEQRTVAPGPETYSTRKVRMEQLARSRFGVRSTILRPCAIHGPWSRHPREWWFVKRILDGRETIPLALSGKSRFQTTSSAMIGNFACYAASRQIGGTFNLGDADAPDVREIGQVIANRCKAGIKFVCIEDYAEGSIGRTPWSIPRPLVVSSDAALGTGFDGDNVYVMAPEGIDWLAGLNPADWRAAFPQLAAYLWDLFDYAAEDRFFASL